jgi:tetratricopeptide (TPR) repeat protein
MISLLLLTWFAGQAAASAAAQHIQAGLDARNQHQVDVEITEFRKATDLDPRLPDAFFNLGAAYMEKRDYASAIAPLKRALELNPDLPAAHQLLGYALLAEGYAAEAISNKSARRMLSPSHNWKPAICRKPSPISTPRSPSAQTIRTYSITSATPAACYPRIPSMP